MPKKLYKLATLLSDMAHRTMFSLTSGSDFNFVAGRWAAKGAKDIIKYTTKAIKQELLYSENRLSNLSAPENLPELSNLDDYVKFLTRAANEFANQDNWSPGYGGKAWKDIAITTAKIALEYKNYLNSTNDSPEQEKAIRKLVVYMNKFDGLAHNNESIYDKLVYLEHDNLKGYDNSSIARNQFDTIMHLRNLSETTNKHEVVKELEKYLDTTLPYKDQLNKLHREPEYFENKYKDTIKQIKEIKQRKQNLKTLDYYITPFETHLVRTKHDVEKVNKNIINCKNSLNSLDISTLEDTIRNISITLDSIFELSQTFTSKYNSCYNLIPLHYLQGHLLSKNVDIQNIAKDIAEIRGKTVELSIFIQHKTTGYIEYLNLISKSINESTLNKEYRGIQKAIDASTNMFAKLNECLENYYKILELLNTAKSFV